MLFFFSRSHPDKSEIVEQKDAASLKPPGQASIRDFAIKKETKKVTSSISAEDLKAGILKNVVYDGVPLTFFSGEGFQLLNGSSARNLGVPLGRMSIRNLVMDKYETELKKLREAVKNKLLYLKFDGVTRLRCHYMGINVQFFCEESEKLVVKTIALMDSNAKHDAESIKKLLLVALKRLGIDKSQVISGVVDNASNMTRTIRLLNEDDHDDDEIAEEEDDEINDEVEEMLGEEFQGEDDETEPLIVEGREIHHMRCASHTFQ